MLNQEDREYYDFLDKFFRSAFELDRDFAKLSVNNKERVGTKLIEFLDAQKKAEMIRFIRNGLFR